MGAAQALGASQQAGAQALREASLAFKSAMRWRDFGAHSQPQAGAQATGAQAAGAQATGAQAGAQALGASQQAGAQQLFSLRHARLAFSRSQRLGRQLFGALSQAGSQALGATQAGAQALGASQQAGAHFSRQARLAFIRSQRLGRQLFGAHASVQPQTGSQALGASQQAGAQALGASQAPEPNRLARALLVATTLKAKRATADKRKRRFMKVTPLTKTQWENHATWRI
ncbi:MAG: hypothetical protein WCJ35_16050 [Planctomycetota bacterium]